MIARGGPFRAARHAPDRFSVAATATDGNPPGMTNADADALLPCVEIEPGSGTADAAVVWLHGLGADGHDFEPIVPELGLPADHRIRFVFPHARRIPVTLNMGMVMPAWYDIRSLDERGTDAAGVQRSAAQVEALLSREKERGVPASRIVLAGFSQGGAIALYDGLRHTERLAGILALSTYLVVADDLESERSDANRDVPILQCHGSFDPMVPERLGAAACETLRGLGYGVRYETYPMQHQVCIEEIRLIGEWLQERLPPA
jgi:phospholipase/carboxylesterase